MRLYIAPLFVVSLLLQGSLLSFPLVFVLLTNLAVKIKKNWIIPLAFVLGIILDSLYLKTFGTTSIFFLLFVFALFIYERKFEIDTSFFIFVSSFLGSMILFLILGDNFASNILLKSFITSTFAVFVSKIWHTS